ncbi:MAG: DUF2442 domain-containing protein [bacterium]
MLYDVIKAGYITDYKVMVEFEDGHSGIVDFAPYIQKGGVFAEFSDLSFFKRFSVSKALGTIVWDGQIDVAPETLYEKCEPYSASADGLPPSQH